MRINLRGDPAHPLSYPASARLWPNHQRIMPRIRLVHHSRNYRHVRCARKWSSEQDWTCQTQIVGYHESGAWGFMQGSWLFDITGTTNLFVLEVNLSCTSLWTRHFEGIGSQQQPAAEISAGRYVLFSRKSKVHVVLRDSGRGEALRSTSILQVHWMQFRGLRRLVTFHL